MTWFGTLLLFTRVSSKHAFSFSGLETWRPQAMEKWQTWIPWNLRWYSGRKYGFALWSKPQTGFGLGGGCEQQSCCFPWKCTALFACLNKLVERPSTNCLLTCPIIQSRHLLQGNCFGIKHEMNTSRSTFCWLNKEGVFVSSALSVAVSGYCLWVILLSLQQCLQSKTEGDSGNVCVHESFPLVPCDLQCCFFEWNLNSEVIFICKRNSKAVLNCSLNEKKRHFGYHPRVLSLDIGCKMCLRSSAFVLWHLWFAGTVACVVIFDYRMKMLDSCQHYWFSVPLAPWELT